MLFCTAFASLQLQASPERGDSPRGGEMPAGQMACKVARRSLCGIAVCFRPVRLSGTLLRAALTAAGENKAEF